ncbi:hypothetical protein M5X11_24820 [Paenibacillus alginolyticus]|uniref:Uncharacterized protein n=1 Tax=Paenibacillus alginolyticus TaxID=59839 RepID=A0ABT4G8K5_9BACL|nr:hypothetical protein [Paenibacillus alginolyticus]MCY9668107.1 hypothetical protein [Paenibacillus alginolyticus]MCY9692470.1 hypothetical protein [Paenibacillus alginolyticus]MEC0144262.1 hypothetical protein [Paenibacillus alginolyticus]
MKRFMFRAQWKTGKAEAGLSRWTELVNNDQKLFDDGEMMTIAGYRWEYQIFLYCECIHREWQPEGIFVDLGEFLQEWPGKSEFRKWIPLVDVFHFNEPVSFEHWKRKQPVERRVGRVAHLRPEMIGSYIYYHYQLQEERAFLGDKYEIIGIHENLLFGYQEFPKVIEEPAAPKKLNTSGTPGNWNDSRMDLHFQPWEDGHLFFKPIEQVFVLYCGDK